MSDNYRGDITDNFKRGIEFLFDTVKDINVHNEFRIEINTSIYNGVNNNKFDEIRKSVINYVEYLRQNYKLKIDFFVRDMYGIFPHSRHFITNQFGITIDKGLDLINTNNKLNQNIFTIMNEEDIREKEKCRSFKKIIRT